MGRPFDFDDSTKDKAFFRQWNRCAHCGQSLVNTWDNAHHVIPNQLGDPRSSQDLWLSTIDNCVILCDQCHNRVHQDGRFRTGAVASPAYFPYSHGNQQAEHILWADRIRGRFWGC